MFKWGGVITIEGENYIVLKQESASQYLLWKQTPISVNSDSDAQKIQGNTSGNECNGGFCIRYNATKSNNVYKDSDIDNFLEKSYYQSLSSDLKRAIVAQDLAQIVRSWTGKGDNGTITDSRDVGTRHVFLASVEDIISLVSNASQKENSIPVSLFKDSNGTEHRYWLRDAPSAKGSDSFSLGCSSHRFGTNGVTAYDVSVRPAFVVDLFLIDFTDTGKTYKD